MRKKTWGHRIFAMALALMMTLSLAATPAFAADDPATRDITVNGAVEGATYRAYQVLKLVDYDKNSNPIAWYRYELTGAESIDDIVKDLIGGDFKVQRAAADVKDEEGTVTVHKGDVTVSGFELAADNKTVMFWTADGWTADAMKGYAARFSNALREAIEDAKLDPADAAETVTATGTTVKIPARSEGYWLVTSDLGAMSMLFTNPDSDGLDYVVNEKNDKPTLEKTVRDYAAVLGNSDSDVTDGSYKSESDAYLGEEIYYKAEIKAGAGTENLTFVDTLSEGLEFKQLLGVTFYPQTEAGADGRQVWAKSKPEEGKTVVDKVSLVDPQTLDGVTALVPSESVTGTVAARSGDQGETLRIVFTAAFLKSTRDGVGNDPMANGDPRLTSDPANTDPTAAHYNVFLGDMDTMADDGGRIVIEYTAVVTEDAIKTNEVENKAHLEYGHNPGNLFGKDPEEGTEESVKTYLYDLDLYKVSRGGDKPLADVSFQIAQVARTDSFIPEIFTSGTKGLTLAGTDVKNAANFYYDTWDKAEDNQDYMLSLVDITDTYTGTDKQAGDKVYRLALADDTETTTTVTTGASGRILVKGLDSSLYVIYETVTPGGYIGLAHPVYAVIGNRLNNIGGNLYVEDVDAQAKSGEGEGAYVVCTFKQAAGDQLKIENDSGIRMPDTGGIGTTVFYITGAVLVLGAAVFLVVRKRSGGEE